MTTTRRGFLKLVAAGAAVAFVPMPEAEAGPCVVAEPPSAALPTLWEVTHVEHLFVPGDHFRTIVELARGDGKGGQRVVVLDMIVDPKSAPLHVLDLVEIDVHRANGRMRICADGKPLPGVVSIGGRFERHYIGIEKLEAGV